MKTESPNQSSQTLYLSQNVKTLLETHKMSESDLARATGLPFMTINRIANGETKDPRVSTLTLICNIFNITIDSLLYEKLLPQHKTAGKSRYIPLVDWEMLNSSEQIKKIDFSGSENWQPIPINVKSTISENAFAIESRPSLYAKFPMGTVFIVDPDTLANDGDLVIVKLSESDDVAIKTLVIDPPRWYLRSLTATDDIIKFQNAKDSVIGVVILTLYYNRKLG